MLTNNLVFRYMSHLTFVGDIHGAFKSIVNKIVHQYGMTDSVAIVCGDIGIWEESSQYYGELFSKLNRSLKKKNNHLVMFRGNHDNPNRFNGEDNHIFDKFTNMHVIPDYTVVTVNTTNVLCVGGAVSVDRILRYNTTKTSYWADECCVFDEEKLKQINKDFPNAIHIVATHTAPSFCYPTTKEGIAEYLNKDMQLYDDLNREREKVMDALFEYVKKTQENYKHHYYAHFHCSKFEEHQGVQFKLFDCEEMADYHHLIEEYATG